MELLQITLIDSLLSFNHLFDFATEGNSGKTCPKLLKTFRNPSKYCELKLCISSHVSLFSYHSSYQKLGLGVPTQELGLWDVNVWIKSLVTPAQAWV